MRVLAYKVGQEPKEIDLENDLSILQEFVGGYLEVVELSHQDLNCVYLLVCNEEGKINNLQANRPVYNEDGELIDIICGDFFICRVTEDNFTDIEDGDIDAIDYTEFIGEAVS